jgi:hypothetical protein
MLRFPVMVSACLVGLAVPRKARQESVLSPPVLGQNRAMLRANHQFVLMILASSAVSLALLVLSSTPERAGAGGF